MTARTGRGWAIFAGTWTGGGRIALLVYRLMVLARIATFALHDVRPAWFLLRDLGHTRSLLSECERDANPGCGATGPLLVEPMLSHVGADERAHGNDPAALRMSGSKRRLDQRVADMTTPQCVRHFGVNQRERVGRSLILQKGKLTIHLHLELLPLGVIDNRFWRCHNPGL
jgi:hypothetical protein